MPKKFFLVMSVFWIALNFITAMSKIGTMSSGPYIYKWTMPFEIAMFLFAGMIPAYFAGRESK